MYALHEIYLSDFRISYHAEFNKLGSLKGIEGREEVRSKEGRV